MTDQFIAEIRIFPYSFAPKGWAFCNGQLIPIAQNTALFSLLGTIYGGNGQSNFAVPNLQSSVPVEAGQGPGLSQYLIGQSGGQETVALTEAQIPAHNHQLMVTTATGTTQASSQNQLAQGIGGSKAASNIAAIYSPNPNKATTPLAPAAIGVTGSGKGHQNMMPYLSLNFCIALQGAFPRRG